MGIDEYKRVAFGVLMDPRTIAVAIAVLAIWGLFRFVGVISQRKPSAPKVKKVKAPKAPKAPKAKKGEAESEIEDDEEPGGGGSRRR